MPSNDIGRSRGSVTNASNFADNAEDILNAVSASSDAVDNLGQNLSQLPSQATGLAGIAGSLKAAFVPLLTNPFTLLAIGAAVAGNALYNYITAFDKAVEKTQESQAAYSQAAAEVSSLNSELEQAQSKITALESKGSLTLTEEAELNRLQMQNTELQRQLDLKQQIAEEKSTATVKDAVEALEYERTSDLTHGKQVTDKSGNVSTTHKKTDIITATKNEISKLENLKNERKELLEKYNNTQDETEKAKYKSQLGYLDTNIEQYSSAIQENLDTISNLRDSFIDQSTGVMKEGLSAEEQQHYKNATDVIDQYNSMDLSPMERQMKSINSFFSGSLQSNAIKDQILSLLESGEIDNATDALHSLGITLTDLGITGEGKKAVFDNYFQELVTSAREADEALNSVDGSFEGVAQASDSANQGAEFDSMKGYLAKADELYKQGLIGTDDFQTAAQFIAPKKIDTTGYEREADAYAAAWENAYAKVKNWFSDEEGSGIHSFSNDLAANGLADVVDDGENWNIDLKFKSSSEAAAKLGTSVEAVELAMAKLEEYGFEFDDVTKSGEGLERYKTALENIRSLYEQTDSEEGKERLGELLSGFDNAYDIFEEDLSLLSEDQIVRIEFEYDLAAVQEQIDSLKQGIENTGGTTEEYGALIGMQRKKRDMLAEQDGMGAATSDEGYGSSLAAFDSLSEQLQSEYDDLGEKGRRAIQQQQEALLELQNTYLELFQDGEVADWESFLNTEDSQDIFEQYGKSTGQSLEEAKEKLMELLDIDMSDNTLQVNTDTSEAEEKIDGIFERSDETIEMNVDASANQIENQLEGLQEGQTLLFHVKADDGSNATITALKSQDGTITYTAVTNGVETTVEAVKNEDGSVSFEPKTDQVTSYQPSDKEAHVKYTPLFGQL